MLSELVTLAPHKISHGYPIRPTPRVEVKNNIGRKKQGIITNKVEYL